MGGPHMPVAVGNLERSTFGLQPLPTMVGWWIFWEKH